MKLIEVNNKQAEKLFIGFPKKLYRYDVNFACPLDPMVKETFDPVKNSFFNHAKAIRWILVDSRNQVLGRIAAFVDFDKANLFEQATGNIGFFECIDNAECATMLFDAARSWLANLGMEAMDGPSNLGENYMNHGLLVDGFMPQGFGMPYNPPYYRNLFEQYGFQVYYEQFSYHVDYTRPFPERFWKIAEWVARKPQYSFRHFEWDKTAQFIDDFAKVYDGAWGKHEHYKPLDKAELRNFILSSKLLLDKEFIWFAYCDNEPIALYVMVPDFNQALRYLKNGRLHLLNLLKLLWFIKGRKFSRIRILIMGVVEAHQRSGIESAILWHLDHHVMPHKKEYKEIELSWAGDFNPKIISLYKASGGIHSKTHWQMRYLFDREKPFVRAKVIE